ncbi:hypothetical protein Y1Q_0016220 [Alligator mississippiensis]|uniref:Uncharacterized protein n=1 Tax=Alligator mississippiensis TaxID=8496 RepID=A0A151NKL6_ALLMI|nr:hypothetical protein Y1Q_0016220 [Alligator mississippiensis]
MHKWSHAWPDSMGSTGHPGCNEEQTVPLVGFAGLAKFSRRDSCLQKEDRGVLTATVFSTRATLAPKPG